MTQSVTHKAHRSGRIITITKAHGLTRIFRVLDIPPACGRHIAPPGNHTGVVSDFIMTDGCARIGHILAALVVLVGHL